MAILLPFDICGSCAKVQVRGTEGGRDATTSECELKLQFEAKSSLAKE